MRVWIPCLATLACSIGLGCSRPNPAFFDQPPDGPSVGRGPSAPDAAPSPDLAVEGPAPAPDPALAAGLIVRYPLDLDATSAVPDDTRTRTGTMHGGASWTSVGFPGAKFANGGALVLDGTTGYVTLPVAGMPTVAGDKSISLWFWQPAAISSLRKTLLTLSNPDVSTGLHIGLQGGRPAVWIWGQFIGTAVVNAQQPSPGGWTHLVFVQQGTAQRLYVNGSPVDSEVATLRSAPATSFMLGGYAVAGGEDELWSGRIDDVRIYGRPLTAAEISRLAAGAL